MTSTLDRVVGLATLDPNRATTPADVAELVRTWRRLSEAEKNHKQATSEYRKALAVWTSDTDVSDMADRVKDTADTLTSELALCRAIIAGLPKGVTGPGGKATRQTVVLQFYGNVNRDLHSRLTASDAKKINTASFGG